VGPGTASLPAGFEALSTCILCESTRLDNACPQNLFYRCHACGLVFDNPRPSWDQIISFYSQEDKYDGWLAEESARDALWRRRLRRVLRHASGGRLLDVGAGIGQFLVFARKHFEVHGTEVSPVAVKIAAEKYGITLREGTLDAVPADERFDVITMFHVLEHVPFPGQTLSRLSSMLKDSGVLILAVPNDVAFLRTRRNRLMRKLGVGKYQSLGAVGLPRLTLSGSEIHLSHFEPGVLARALERAGVEVTENGLDPYFAVQGRLKLRHYGAYYRHEIVRRVTGQNLYETIWVAARKKPSSH
jgi:2-polyprenyl-3-methyl-5-hydroxy-6-metoxy-1,4-benzoquinol methylase